VSAWLALTAAICTSLVGQVLLKTGANAAVGAGGGLLDQILRLPTLAGLACYGGSAILYIVALRQIPMSVALPATAASYVVIAAIGFLVFQEPMPPQKLAAIGLIAAGVALLATA
jgi:small multidrug resistance pump